MLVISAPISGERGRKTRLELHVLVDVENQHLGRMAAAFALRGVGIVIPILAGTAGRRLSFDFHIHDEKRIRILSI